MLVHTSSDPEAGDTRRWQFAVASGILGAAAFSSRQKNIKQSKFLI